MDYMKLALELAEKYRGKTSPNPLVGAVIVKNGKIIGKGAHQKAGESHAEVFALKEAGENSKNATMFVTLEPCCHHGKTPPCTEQIIAAGIRKVVIALQDPNPLVAGKGIARLRAAGIDVQIGQRQAEAQQQNEVFLHYIRTKTPFVIAKAALSLDGKIAATNGDSKWISNEISRQKVHQLRSFVDAILIGKNTFLKDDPSLNVRLEKIWEGPQKIIIIPKLDIAAQEISNKKVYKNSITRSLIIACHHDFLTAEKKAEFQEKKIELIAVAGKKNAIDLSQLLYKLGKKEITSLLIEGGSKIFTEFLQARVINKFHLFSAPIFLGNAGIPFLQDLQINSIKAAVKLQSIKIDKLEKNVLWTGYLK